MPDWLCHTMLNAVERASIEVRFYELDDGFKASVEALDKIGFRDGDAMLMVNYFGLQDLTEISKTVKESYPNSVLIEDDVQAYWSFAEKQNPYADYRFTSLRKSFAIPDGGLVYTKRQMPIATQPNTFAPLKLKAAIMKQYRREDGINDQQYLSLFERAESLINKNYDSCMSNDSKRLFAGTDVNQAKLRRQINSTYIVSCLVEMGIKPIIEVTTDSVPLFIPICINNRDKVRHHMFQKGIYCPVHWPLMEMDLKHGTNMAAHELSLIIDQRYDENDMNRILKNIRLDTER